MADQADGQHPQLGFWPLLSVFSQPEGFQMESQVCLQAVQGDGAELEDQTSKAVNTREARDFDSATGNQSSLVNGIYA